MRERIAVAVCLATLASATWMGAQNDPRGLALQAILSGTLAIFFILLLRSQTEHAVFAGGVFASLAVLGLLIAAPLIGVAGGFESYMVHQVGVVAGSVASARSLRRIPGKAKQVTDEHPRKRTHFTELR